MRRSPPCSRDSARTWGSSRATSCRSAWPAGSATGTGALPDREANDVAPVRRALLVLTRVHGARHRPVVTRRQIAHAQLDVPALRALRHEDERLRAVVVLRLEPPVRQQEPAAVPRTHLLYRDEHRLDAPLARELRRGRLAAAVERGPLQEDRAAFPPQAGRDQRRDGRAPVGALAAAAGAGLRN